MKNSTLTSELLFPINLRLFGEPDEEPGNDDEQSKAAEPGVEEKTEEPGTATESEPQKKADSVPLATYLAEKKKAKELERKLRELDDARLEDDIKNRRNLTEKDLIDKGFDENVAKEMAGILEVALKEVHSDRKRRSEEDLFNDELTDLAKEAYYADIKSFEKEIRAKMDKVKGLTIEEAYMLVRGPGRNREVQTEVEQKQALKRREGIDKENPNSEQPAKQKTYKLDADDLAALEMLQKVQPEAKWDKKKYYEIMKGR